MRVATLTVALAIGLIAVDPPLGVAQTASSDPAPADVTPALWERVPRQRTGDPFAVFSLGAEWHDLDPTRTAHGGRLRSAGLTIGALHFFGHADLFVTIPVAAFTTQRADGRDASLLYAAATGVRVYPWALRAGAVRPFVTTALEARRWRVAHGPDVTQNPGESVRVRVPVGGGLSWRTRQGLTFDAQLAYVRDTTAVPIQVFATPSTRAEQTFATRSVSLSGVRATAGLKWSHGLSPSAQSDFRAAVGRRLQGQATRGVLTTFNLAAGPSARIAAPRSSYIDERRPYLRDRLRDAGFVQSSIGYYDFAHDAEVRIAFRTFGSRADAFGVDLKTRHTSVFAEGLKFFDAGYHGFVPFVGAGVGASRLTAQETVSAITGGSHRWAVVPSIVTGWDIRPDPGSPVVLRTNIRWVPRARLAMPSGHALDLGGVEYDFIQVVIFPKRFRR